MSIITMPLEGITGGETGDIAETFSAPIKRDQTVHKSC